MCIYCSYYHFAGEETGSEWLTTRYSTVGGGVQTWPLTVNHSVLLPCIRMSSQPSLEACTPV